MKNKVLIKLIVLEFCTSFDVFIPVNEVVWKIKELLIKSINDLTGVNIDSQGDYELINKNNCRVYKNNEIIINTDIRNSTELIILSK